MWVSPFGNNSEKLHTITKPGLPVAVSLGYIAMSLDKY